MKQGSQGKSARTMLLGCLAVAWLAAGLACSGGCGSDRSPDTDAAQAPADGGKADSGTQGKAGGPTDPSGASAEARRVLDAMVAAYKKTPSYADTGTVRLYAKRGEEQPIDQTADFSVTFVRPNKLRVHAYAAEAVCDGKQFWAFIRNLPGQVVSRPAPEKLTAEFLLADPVLAGGLTQGFAGPSTPLVLLLLDDPLAHILEGAAEPELLAPEKIGSAVCDRVQVRRKDGTAVLWIDQQARVLRRIEYPTARIAYEFAGGQKLDEIWMVADFTAAQLGGRVDATAFAFEAPPDVKPQEFFIRPNRGQLLGNPAPQVRFEGLDGKGVALAASAGKPTVLYFWETRCQPCLKSLPSYEKLSQKYKDKVTFLAVSLDPPGVSSEAVGERFTGLGMTFPTVRDAQQVAAAAFMVDGTPVTFIIGGDSRVQDFELGANPNVEVDLPAKLDKLLAGQDLCQGKLEDYQRWLADYKATVKQRLEGKTPEGPMVREQEIPRVQIAPRSEPKNLKLTPLWKYADLKTPGNILVAPRADGTPRILVVDASRFHSVVELGPDGKLAATHTLPIKDEELVAVLTSAVGADRKRYFTGTAIGQQRVHLFDESFKLLVSYPEDALENRHAGIWDAQLADLDGDGTLELYVGYWGPVGVQGATLEGRRKWSYRRIESVMRLAAGGPDPKGQRLLWCTHNRGTLVALDDGGNPKGELAVQNRPIHSIFAADLTGDGQPEWCGLLSVAGVGRTVAIGFNLQGEELWTYEVPKGVHPMPVEPVIPGRISSSGPGQWLLPGPDGSIHILGADGKLIDRFNYGAAVHGLATAMLGGQPALIVATPEGVEAWRVQ